MKYSVLNRSVSHVLRGVIGIDDATEGYLKAKEYYDGDPKEIFGNDAIGRDLERTGRDYIFRLSKTPVDVLANRCKLATITSPSTPIADESIQLIRDANEMAIWEREITRTTFTYGDCYVMATPVDVADTDETPKVRAAGIRVTMISPVGCRAIYDDLSAPPSFVVRELTSPVEHRRLIEVYYPDGVAVWMTNSNKTLGRKAEEWVPVITDELPEGYYNYPFVGDFNPIFHFRNAIPYGVPEHRDAYGPQNAINNMLITLINTNKSQGYPTRYVLSDPAVTDDNPAPANLFADGDPSSTPDTNTGNQQSAPGVIMRFNDAKSVGQFQAAQPDVFLTPVDKFITIMSQTTSTPLYAFNPGGEQPSGEARRIADAPLADKVEDRELRLGGTWSALWQFVLYLKNIDVTDIDVRWGNAGVATDSDTWGVIRSKQDSGVPVRTTLIEAGYSDDEVTKWLDENSDEMTLTQRIDEVAKVADILAKTAPLVAQGLMTQDQWDALTASLLGQVVPSTTQSSTPTDVPLEGTPAVTE